MRQELGPDFRPSGAIQIGAQRISELHLNQGIDITGQFPKRGVHFRGWRGEVLPQLNRQAAHARMRIAQPARQGIGRERVQPVERGQRVQPSQGGFAFFRQPGQ